MSLKLNIIIQGDALAVLKTLPDKLIQTVVTSPPYWGLRDYGVNGQLGLEKTPEEYVEKIVDIFSEVRRVVKDDGTLWLNLGDTYINNSIPGGGDPTIGKRNIGSSKYRVNEANGFYKPKDLVGIPWMVALALRADGWYLRQDIIWHKLNPMPEAVKDRCTKAHEYVFLLSKSKNYYYDQDAIKEPASYNTHERKSRTNTSHKSYPTDIKNGIRSPKSMAAPTGWDTSKGNGGHSSFHKSGRRPSKIKNNPSFDEAMAVMPDERNKRSVWSIVTEAFPQAHFATFPKKLIEPCIKAGSRENDIVLDPFMGSGTTASVCDILNRRWIGIELNPEYIDIAYKSRLAQRVLEL